MSNRIREIRSRLAIALKWGRECISRPGKFYEDMYPQSMLCDDMRWLVKQLRKEK